jgi:MoxR-like ATPase
VSETALTDRVRIFEETFARLRRELTRVVVGQPDLVEHVLLALVAGGHVLLEGLPGLGKTLLVRTLAQALDLSFSRIQFTPDLMPADISGTTLVEETPEGRRAFRFSPGPVFANLVLADEINRATPKTQSALLEAMQEGRVTVAGEARELPAPFLVMATQNPIEMEGTYPLPEAQVDRFLFKLQVGFPEPEDLIGILDQTTGNRLPTVEAVCDAPTLLEMGRLAREVVAGSAVLGYAARLVLATHPDRPEAPEAIRRYVRHGSSPRGGQALVRAARVRAMVSGRYNVAFEDLQAVARPCLRHRLIRSFEGEAEGLEPEQLLEEVLRAVPLEVPA